MDNEENIEDLSNRFKNQQREKIKSDFESFSQYDISSGRAKDGVIIVEELSNELENVEREKIKADVEKLISYNTSIQEIKSSVRGKLSGGRSTSYKKNHDTFNSDIKYQTEEDSSENWETLRKHVYKRDDYSCRLCGARGGIHGDTELHAHHIKPKMSGGQDRLENLILSVNHVTTNSTIMILPQNRVIHSLIMKHLNQKRRYQTRPKSIRF